MGDHHLFCDGQSQASSAQVPCPGFIDPVESFEYLLQFIFRNAHAFILDADFNKAFPFLQPECQLPAFRRVLNGIGYRIIQYLCDLIFVDFNKDRLVRNLSPERYMAFFSDFKPVDDMIKEIAINNSDVFTVGDLILARKYSEALSLISEVLQKEHYLPTLALIQTMFSNMLKTPASSGISTTCMGQWMESCCSICTSFEAKPVTRHWS